MSYYRRLPLDARVAIWVGEHPKFMQDMGIAAITACAVGMCLFLGWIVS